jgi:Rrf2 family iron-sulfur cluster assembly transcriptional regulator
MAGLATVPAGTPVRATDLSRATGVPPHYLAKVLRRLVLAGLLVSQKGQGGGFSLARSTDDISFLDILIAVDAFPDENRCAFGWDVCDEAHPCPLHGVWSHLDDVLRAWATTSTLTDVLNYSTARHQILIPTVTAPSSSDDSDDEA